jgi:membrane protease subunit (stomatin/prohibitin family)
MTEIIQLIKSFLEPVWLYIVLFSPLKMTFLQEGEIGGRFFLGKEQKLLGPGLHFGTSLQTLQKEWGEGNLVTLAEGVDIFTDDWVAMYISASARYNIVDFFKFQRNTDAEALIHEQLEASVVAAYSGINLTAATSDVTMISDEIRKALAKTCKPYGVEIKSVMIQSRLIKDRSMERSLALAAMAAAANVDFTDDHKALILAGAVPVSMATNR